MSAASYQDRGFPRQCAGVLRSVVVVGVVLLGIGTASAQSPTTGAIQGRVTDARTHEPLADVTIRATAGRDELTARTAPDGTFKIGALIPGDYDIVFADGAGHGVVRHGVRVSVFAVTQLVQAIDRQLPGMVDVDAPVSAIDPTSAAVSFVADRNYLRNLPVPGRSFDSVMGAAPGGRGDGYGVAFLDSTSLDNRYFVDGIDTTELRLGNGGTFLPNDLLREVTVLTGGYSVEYGRATGGIVSAVTRSGTNELHGSIFGALSPGVLRAAANVDTQAPQTIDISSERAYDTGFGFELSGPIVKDRLWFFVGFAPQLARTDYTRKIQSRSDCRMVLPDGALSGCQPQYADGSPDVNPKTGFEIVETVDSEVRSASARSYPAVAKIDLALPQHQATASAIVVPATTASPGLVGAASTGSRISALSSDVSAQWVSRFLDNSLQLEAGLAWHRATTNSGSFDPAYDNVTRTALFATDVSQLAPLGTESAKTIAACTDGGSGDRYPTIENCPLLTYYPTGGPGARQHDREDRRSLRLAVSDRVHAIGIHDLKAGIEATDEFTDTARVYSGGQYVVADAGSTTPLFVDRFANLASPGDTDPRFNQTCSDRGTMLTFNCQIVGGTPGAPGSSVDGESIAWAAYARDSWRVRSNLVIDAGLRYESQRLLYPEDLRGAIDPLTGRRLGDTAIALRRNVAPRGGVIYDPTNEGRAKVFAHWGRYFEALPTQIIGDYFARSVLYMELPPSGTSFGTNRLAVDPHLKAGYVDELVAGGQYEPLPDLTLGATWQRRRLGRAIEDVSADGSGAPYLLANPGIGPARSIEKPVRDYDALRLTVARRFSPRLYLQASYVYSRSVGNHTGTIDYDDDSFSATHTSPQFDQTELLANRGGALPQDRPHYLKLDSFYTIPIGGRSAAVIGARFRALSGVPENARGNSAYGSAENFLLPRGSLGRTEFTHAVDLHVAYRRRLSHGMTAEVYVDVFNVYDQQATFSVDDAYTTSAFSQSTTPISGGTYSDLIWLKANSSIGGTETVQPADRNPRFGKTTSRYAPTYGTIGARVTF